MGLPHTSEPVSPKAWQEMERLLGRFDEAWQSATPPELEPFLASIADESRTKDLLVELINMDLEYRWRGAAQGRSLSLSLLSGQAGAGPLPQCPRLEAYIERFPLLGPLHLLPVSLIGEEYRSRQRWGDRPEHDEYFQRFAAQAAELRSLLKRIDDDLAVESRLPPGPPPRKVGRYELRKVIGKGAYGLVWQAWDTQQDREVAVKLPRSGQWMGPEEEERFLREACSTARLRHDGIVSVHDVGRDGEVIYLVADLVRGVTLAERLRKERLTIRQAAEVVAQLAEAVDYAHQMGVVHRDLKPSNIMLAVEEGVTSAPLSLDSVRTERDSLPKPLAEARREPLGFRPRIMDFGVAKRDSGETTMTRDGQILGTPAYMSPEQIRNPHAADRRSDVYSLGVILYQLLSGELPFHGESRELLRQVQHAEPRPLRRRNPDIPLDVEAITLKSLAKDPNHRYWTAGELADDLRRWLGGEPIRARPLAESLWRRWRRHPAVIAVAAVALLGLGTILGLELPALWQTPVPPSPVESDPPKPPEPPPPALPPLDRLAADQIPAAERVPGQPKELVAVLGEHRQRHWGVVRSVAYHPKGELVASGGADGFIRLWDNTVRERYALKAHKGGVSSVAYAPDGISLASGGADGTVRIWEDKAATERQPLAPGVVTELTLRETACLRPPVDANAAAPEVTALAFAQDGKTLATAFADGKVRLWDMAWTPPKEKAVFSAVAEALAFSPDGTTLVTGGAGKMTWWVLAGVKPKKRFEYPAQPAERRQQGFAFTTDGKLLASAGSDGITLWEFTTGQPKEPKFRIAASAAAAVAFAPDNKALAAAGLDARVRLWDLGGAEPKERFELRGHASDVQSIAFAPDGQSLVSAGSDQTVRLWDLAAGLERNPLQGHFGPTGSVAFLGVDGRFVSSWSSDRSTLKLWDTVTAKESASFGESPVAAFAADGELLVTRDKDGTVKIWDVATGTRQGTYQGNGVDDIALAFAADNTTVLMASKKGAIRLWNTETDEEAIARTGEPEEAVSYVAFAANGKLAALGYASGIVRLWDLVEKKERAVLPGHTSDVVLIAFAPDSQALLTKNKDEPMVLKLWDATTGKERGVLKGHASDVSSLAFAPAGPHLATGSRDGVVKLWDLQTGKMLATFANNSGEDLLAFGPDGNALAMTDAVGRLVVWNCARESKQADLEIAGPVLGIAIAPDGRHLATANANGTIYILRLLDRAP
jgi:WD40 repeat protein/serine/threonine protein kinase